MCSWVWRIPKVLGHEAAILDMWEGNCPYQYHLPPSPDPQLTTCLKICLSLHVLFKKENGSKANQSYLYYSRVPPPSEVGLINDGTPKDVIDMHGIFLTAETEPSPRVISDPKDDHLLLTFEATN